MFSEDFTVFGFHVLGYSLAGSGFGKWHGQEPSFDFLLCLFDPRSMLQSLFLHFSGGYATPRLSLSLTGCGKSIKPPISAGRGTLLDPSHQPTDCPRMESGPRLFRPSISPFLSQATQVRSEDSPCLLRHSSPCLHVIAPKEHQACFIPSGSRVIGWAGLRMRERERVELTSWHEGTHEEND